MYKTYTTSNCDNGGKILVILQTLAVRVSFEWIFFIINHFNNKQSIHY